MRAVLTAAAMLQFTLAAPAAGRPVPLGTPVTLHGIPPTLELVIRPYRVIDPLRASAFDQPQPGQRFVGVRVSLRNVGAAQYQDSPGNGARLVGISGHPYESTILASGPCETEAGVVIPHGQKRLICIAFAIPSRARLRYFEFALNSGFAQQLGQWRL